MVLLSTDVCRWNEIYEKRYYISIEKNYFKLVSPKKAF
jgi:hypothetical protein